MLNDALDMESWEEFFGAEGSWCTRMRIQTYVTVYKYKEIHSRLRTGRFVSKILTHKFVAQRVVLRT